MGNGKVRSVGLSMAMQGSGISGVDVGSATIKLNDDGLYTLSIAAADMGTGCDTILAQMAAECLECSIDDIMEQIQIHHHTILDLTHQVLPTSQEKQWNVPAKN